MIVRRLYRIILSFLGGTLFAAAFMLGVAAQGNTPVLSILKVDDTEFPAVRITVAASDVNGRALSGLAKDAFLILEDGTPVEISAVKPLTSGVPLYLALAIDTSGSMKGEPLQATRDAVRSLVQQLTPQDRVSLITFGTEVNIPVPLTVTHGAVITALQNITLTQYTRLYDGAYQAIRTLQSVPPGRRAVIIMTDGKDTKSTLTLDDVVQEAQRLAVPIYIVGYGKQINVQDLERLAQRTGGAFFQAPSVEQIPAAFSEVFEILRKAYEITYVSNIQADGKEHELRVTLTMGGTSVQVVNRFVARPGNFHVQLQLDNLPDQEVAKRIWLAMGKQPVSATVPYVTEKVALSPQTSGAGRIIQAQYELDGNVLAEITTEPFTFTWDTSQVVPDLHTLSLAAEDHVGNKANNTRDVAVIPPVYMRFQAPQAGAKVTGTVPITVSLIGIYPIASVQFQVDGQDLGKRQVTQLIPPGAEAKVEYAWATQTFTEGPHVLRILATTEDGHVFSSTQNVNVGKHVLVNILEPIADAKLEGPSHLKAHVVSDAPVEQVRFLVDDKEVAVDSVAPYETQIHTGDFSPGRHRIRVVARNQAGQQGRAEVSVMMVPAPRSGTAFILLIALGVLILIGVPVAFLGIRSRRNKIPPPVESEVGIQGGDARQLHQPAAWLFVSQGDLPQTQYQLYMGENRIGRNRDFADIWVPDLSVSRRHAIIYIQDGRAELVNLNKHNPMFVNGKPIKDRSLLHDGDQIRMGNIVFTFRL